MSKNDYWVKKYFFGRHIYGKLWNQHIFIEVEEYILNGNFSFGKNHKGPYLAGSQAG